MDFTYFCKEKDKTMILIADSGSTKTDWALICNEKDNGSIKTQQFQTQGINPIYMSEEEIVKILKDELLPQLSSNSFSFSSNLLIHFYGAGCREDMIPKIKSAFVYVFSLSDSAISVQSDLMGAARALCGREEGVACILGTGSNSCLYDGERIVKNVSPMGFILGDEGSGAVLGKLFVNLLYKDQLPEIIRKEFEEKTGYSLTYIINKVYREPLPNRFLASLVPFIYDHLDVPEIKQMVIDNFRSFFVRNVQHYHAQHLKVNAVGSVAFYFKECLCQAAELEGYKIGIVMKNPLDSLVKYHQFDGK